MEVKYDVIYNGQCNFCRKKKKVMFVNFQAICKECATAILINFKTAEERNESKV